MTKIENHEFKMYIEIDNLEYLYVKLRKDRKSILLYNCFSHGDDFFLKIEDLKS